MDDESYIGSLKYSQLNSSLYQFNCYLCRYEIDVSWDSHSSLGNLIIIHKWNNIEEKLTNK
jgi:hypothetical protein